ncbi:riboflavin transporter [Kurthia zopfii]|uniref:Riboflavin transporter n=1 Tax=Kurthia zopfii TaxID=1650 RepID=A0A2U3AG10_9BACL|nr:ECF transporter S component [Kurthia zopfii]PWI23434.1 riboflavin transporter FmnP [Kurthia zopfii]TDR39830.1 riboflavin transporter FmnP [Kurthia zopfii]STX09279.1 Riboflavin ECF transporter S component FmnP [Kurthia zopfii]VEI06214.1 Riboflavin ECF transporter S component FmnP [Kurthia zopfii]GEK30718.1 riboflavin transporter [Kurthia zopfii]
MKNKKLLRMIAIGMMSAIAFLLHLVNFPIPPFPNFLEVDFGDIPALIAVIIMGPVAGILVELLKNVIDWVYIGSPTGVPVGHMANFVTGLLFILPTYFVYTKLKTKKGLTIGLILGTATMAIGMSVLNYFVFMPMYNYFLNMPVETGAALRNTIVIGVLPFNIIKGVLVTIVFLLLYRVMNNWMIKQQKVFNS